MVFQALKCDDYILKTKRVMSLRDANLERQIFYLFVFGTQPKFQIDISSSLEVRMLRKKITVMLKTGIQGVTMPNLSKIRPKVKKLWGFEVGPKMLRMWYRTFLQIADFADDIFGDLEILGDLEFFGHFGT
jgi:hypothetical protein